MKRAICILALACVGAAQAQTVIDDFSAGSAPYVLPTDGSYASNPSAIPGPLFDTRNLSGSNYTGNNVDLFTSSISGGLLTSQGAGAAGGELDLGYSNSSGEVDLSAYNAITVTIESLSAPVQLGWGFFSDSYANESDNDLTVSSPGTVRLSFASLLGSPFAPSKVDTLFIDVAVSGGQSISISQVAAVPEPAPFAAMGLGIGLLAVRRRRSRQVAVR